MESYMLLGFVGIVREVPKMFLKNGRLMASLTLLILSFSSIYFLSNFFCIKPLIADYFITSLSLFTNPTSPELPYLLLKMKQDISEFLGVEWIFAIIGTVASLFFATSTIMASAVAHSDRHLSLKELLLSTMRSLKRPFHTWFFTALLSSGYFVFVLVNLLPMMLNAQNAAASKAFAITVGVVAFVGYTYLAVVWILALVVSVVEDESGIEALAKAAKLVKGMQLQGFLLNLIIKVSTYALFQGIRLIPLKQSSSFQVMIGLFVVLSIRLVSIFGLMAFTVFYHHCKKAHGEEVELQVSFHYTKIPTTSLLSQNIP